MIKGLFIGSCFSIMLFFLGNSVFKKNQKYTLKIFLIQLVYIFLYTLSYMYMGDLSIFARILLVIIFYKLIFKEDISKIITCTTIIFGVRYLLEFIMVLLDASIFFYIPLVKYLSEHEIINNLLVTGGTLIIIYKFRNKLNNFLLATKIYSIKYVVCTLLVVTLVPIVIILKKYAMASFYKIHISTELLLLIILALILYTIIKQKQKIENITKQYTEATEYYKMTEGLLEEYRYILHENRNQLLVIKSMIKDNQELEEYLNNLINGRRNLKYEWVCDLKNIPIQGLKGLVNYKIADMKRRNLNVEIYIDDVIGKIKLGNLTQHQHYELYSIVGIFLDNALEASTISKEKMVSIQCYKEKKQVHIMIANTYSGKIDLNKINDLGYSSKGKDRGIGLPLVNKIVKNSPVYKNETELFDIFFVQHLYIKIPNNTKN